MRAIRLVFLCLLFLHSMQCQMRRIFRPRLPGPLVANPSFPIRQISNTIPVSLRGVITSLQSAINPNRTETASVIREIISLVRQYSGFQLPVTRVTRATIEVLILGRPVEMGFTKSMSASSAETVANTVKTLNNLPAEQLSILKTTLARIINVRYNEQMSVQTPPPPTYEMSPEVQIALDSALSSLTSKTKRKTGNGQSEKILSDIIGLATRAESNSRIPLALSSAAKIVVDAFISGQSLKPGHPSTAILQALNELPPDQASVLISQFLRVIAFNPVGDMGIIDGTSSIVVPVEKPPSPTQPSGPLDELMLGTQSDIINQNAMTQFELEQQRRADKQRTAQLLHVEELNRLANQEASRRIERMNLQSQRRADAATERLRQLGNRNQQVAENFRRRAEMMNSRPVDMNAHLWSMNSNLLREHGQEAQQWLQNAIRNPTAESSTALESVNVPSTIEVPQTEVEPDLIRQVPATRNNLDTITRVLPDRQRSSYPIVTRVQGPIIPRVHSSRIISPRLVPPPRFPNRFPVRNIDPRLIGRHVVPPYFRL